MVGKKLEELLMTTGMDYKELAAMLNCETCDIEEYISGKRIIKDNTLEQVCKLFGLSKEFFIGKAVDSAVKEKPIQQSKSLFRIQDIPSLIVRYRKVQGLSQKQLAIKLSVSVSTLSAYELGTKSIPVDLLDSMYQLLNIPIDELLYVNTNCTVKSQNEFLELVKCKLSNAKSQVELKELFGFAKLITCLIENKISEIQILKKLENRKEK